MKDHSLSLVASILLLLGACATPPELQLIRAARSGNAEIVKRLLAEGVGPNVATLENDTPLQYAAFEGHAAVVEILLAAGANPNIQNEGFGSTPLMNAGAKGHIEVVRLLIANAADLELRNKKGMTAIWSAASYGPSDRRRRAEVVQLLAQAGADVNATALPKQVPILVFPVGRGHFETVYVLLKAGADPHATDSEGYSAMALAKEIGNSDMIGLLEGRRAP